MKIKDRREQLGISQKELAEAVGIAQSTMCDIEQGRCKPSFDVSIRIADKLKLKKEASAMMQGSIIRSKLFE